MIWGQELDIVEKALAYNREKAESKGLGNLNFVNYNGLRFPFEDKTFDMAITRYVLHHFPAVRDTFHEINRVLKPGGTFFLSDPAPNDDDTSRFVDAYMQMKKDGHIKFIPKRSGCLSVTWKALFLQTVLEPKSVFLRKKIMLWNWMKS